MNYDTNYNDMESYLLDKMSNVQQSQFELKLEQDPILQTELEFQKDTIEAIKEARKQEFKARFDKIPVNNSNSLMFKGILATVGITLVTTASLLFFQNTNNSNFDIQVQNYKTEQTSLQNNKTTLDNEIKPKHKTIKNSQNNTLNIVTPEKKYNHKSNQNLQHKTKSVTPHPTAKEENSSASKMLRIENLIQNTLTQATSLKEIQELKNLDLKNKNSKSANDKENILDKPEFKDTPKLYYQFYNSNIFLYPENAERAPVYEQLSLHDEKAGEIKYYIYYKETYYRLYENQKSTVEADKITDKELLDKLSKLKEEKVKNRLKLLN